MILGDIKSLIRAEMSADRAVNEATFNSVIYRALKNVCSDCIPLSLISSGMGGGEVLRFIDDVNYIRTPDVPLLDTDRVDIDELLEDAVIYATCTILSRDRKGDYKQLLNEAINRYQWAIYEGESNDIASKYHHRN